MTAERLAEQIQNVAPKVVDFHCRTCGNWVTRAPAPWARGRCTNKPCKLYHQQQTMYAPR